MQRPRLELVMTALGDYGLVETPGSSSSADIMAMARELGAAYPGDEVAWCGLACAAWVKRAGGAPPKGFLAARSWLQWGEAAVTPELGDIAVLWRTSPAAWEGHVGIFIGHRAPLVYLLGGNQNNAVTIAAQHADRVLGYRRGYKL